MVKKVEWLRNAIILKDAKDIMEPEAVKWKSAQDLQC